MTVQEFPYIFRKYILLEKQFSKVFGRVLLSLECGRYYHGLYCTTIVKLPISPFFSSAKLELYKQID